MIYILLTHVFLNGYITYVNSNIRQRSGADDRNFIPEWAKKIGKIM